MSMLTFVERDFYYVKIYKKNCYEFDFLSIFLWFVNYFSIKITYTILLAIVKFNN